jgi:site-specific DNA-cytosine methylase
VRIGSCFSGVAAMDRGVSDFFGPDASTDWFIEREAYPRKVLARHFPGVPIYEDITTINPADLEPVDILIGGPPCTDLSVAGKGAGLHGDKSRLFFDMVNIAAVLKPRYVMIENSPVLLNDWRGTVEGAFADAGYGVTWARLSAAHMGAPHLRWRCFLLAELGGSHKGVCFPPALPIVVRWATPQASDTKDRGTMGRTPAIARRVAIGKQITLSMQTDGARLSADWVETLQGLPVNWTALEGDLDPRPWPAHRADGMWGDSPQHDHEPPRLCDPKQVPNRRARLKALGNLNPPAVYTRALEMLMNGPRQGMLFD